MPFKAYVRHSRLGSNGPIPGYLRIIPTIPGECNLAASIGLCRLAGKIYD
jgi:hypothetical protein